MKVNNLSCWGKVRLIDEIQGATEFEKIKIFLYKFFWKKYFLTYLTYSTYKSK